MSGGVAPPVTAVEARTVLRDLADDTGQKHGVALPDVASMTERGDAEVKALLEETTANPRSRGETKPTHGRIREPKPVPCLSPRPLSAPPLLHTPLRWLS